MDGKKNKLLQLLDGGSKKFVIPVYQRNYDWKLANCKQLFDDLESLIINNRSSHFFGSIVSSVSIQNSINEYLVIDGQQRLTTVSILLLAMYNLMQSKEVEPSKEKLDELIYETYLIDKWQPEETRLKLKPIKKDEDAFIALFENDNLIEDSNVTINFNYFIERILQSKLTIDELYEAILKLEIINIELDEKDDPQLIFESLNSTGLALEEGDKVRNFLLMGANSKDQNRLYEKYWKKIELSTGSNLSRFLRDFLSSKTRVTPSISKVYYAFKEYQINNKIDREHLLDELAYYAKNYEILLGNKDINPELSSLIYRLNRLETTVTRPYFLEVLKLFDNNDLEEKNLYSIFNIIENYIIRRSICSIPTNALNKIFLTLNNEIMKVKSNDSYIDKLKYILIKKSGNARYPKDEEFLESLESRQIYNLNNKTKIYLLERLENNGTKEDKDVYRHIENGDYSIEHIMPQTLTNKWVEMLGDEYDRIHEKWLHRLANLTLTAYNNNYSNSSFEKKKTMENIGFLDSGLRMNQYISKFDKWSEQELIARNSHLLNLATNIWPMIESDIDVKESIENEITLEDQIEFTGRKFKSFIYKGIEQEVESVIDLYKKVLETIYDENPSVFYEILSNKNNNILDYNFSADPNNFRTPDKLSSNLYYEKNLSNATKFSILAKILDLAEIEKSSLVFIVKDELDNKKISSIQNQRKDFWKYILPKLKENLVFDNYNNLNPSQAYWLGAEVFNIKNITLNCQVHPKSSKVMLYIDNKDKKINDEIFNSLHAKRSKIDEIFNYQLEWDNNKYNRHNKILITLDNIGVKTENKWHEIIDFFTANCNLFYEVFSEYLKEFMTK